MEKPKVLKKQMLPLALKEWRRNLRQNYLTLNKTLRNQILTQSPDGSAAHSVIDKWFPLRKPFLFPSQPCTEAIITLTTPPALSKLGNGKRQASLHLTFCSYFLFFAHPTSLASLPLIYSIQCCRLMLLPNPLTCFPCSPAVGSPSAWWTCLLPSLPVCHIPPAGILSGYKVCLAHNMFPLLVDGSPQFGQFLKGRKGEGWTPNVLPTDTLLSSIQNWLGV